MAKKGVTKKASGNRRGRQLGASAKELSKARAAAKRQGKTGGRPKAPPKPEKDLEAAILERASVGVEPEDIARLFDLEKRLNEDVEFRGRFDSLVKKGEALLREQLARKLTGDALRGKVTPLKEMAEAWLERHMDEAPMRDFASGTYDRVVSQIEKAKASLKKRKAAKT